MRTPQLHALAITLAVVLVAGLAVGQTVGPRAAIEAANARFSADFAKGDATAVASHYTAAAQVFPPNGDVVRGREAIAKFWKGVMDTGIKGPSVRGTRRPSSWRPVTPSSSCRPSPVAERGGMRRPATRLGPT